MFVIGKSIGGGIPCDVVVRTFDPSNSALVVSVERGCLLIATGNEIALHPAKDAGRSGCTLAQVVGHQDNEASRWDVDIYPQSAIVKMSILTKRVAQARS